MNHFPFLPSGSSVIVRTRRRAELFRPRAYASRDCCYGNSVASPAAVGDSPRAVLLCKATFNCYPDAGYYCGIDHAKGSLACDSGSWKVPVPSGTIHCKTNEDGEIRVVCECHGQWSNHSSACDNGGATQQCVLEKREPPKRAFV